MKTRKSFIAALVMALALAFTMSPAQAADKIFDEAITRVDVRIDKNGSEYVRLIVPEKRSLNGVEYLATVAIMAFGETVEQAKQLKAGDQLKAICSSSEYNGRTSYQVLAFIQ